MRIHNVIQTIILIYLTSCNSQKSSNISNSNSEVVLFEDHCGSCHSISTNTVALSIQEIYKNVNDDDFLKFTNRKLDSLSKDKINLYKSHIKVDHPKRSEISNEDLNMIIDYIRTSSRPIY